MMDKFSKTVDHYHLVDNRFTTIRGRQIYRNSPGLHQIDSRAWIHLTEENFPLSTAVIQLPAENSVIT